MPIPTSLSISMDMETYPTARFDDLYMSPSLAPRVMGSLNIRARPTRREMYSFTVTTDEEVEFFQRVYWGAEFGSRARDAYRHDDFIVTPDHCTATDLAFITNIRTALGLTSFRGNPADFARAAPPGPRSRRLERNEIEALPLPG